MADIKRPVTGGVAKVPVIMQLEALECGAASLAMVMAYYGKWTTLEQARSDCGVSRDGSNALNISKAAKSYGFEVKTFKRSPESIRKKGVFPCIIHWDMDHFVVLRDFKGKYAYINDPARGSVKIDAEEFDRSFSGVTINITPSDSFQPGGKRKSVAGSLTERFRAAGTAYAYGILLTANARRCIYPSGHDGGTHFRRGRYIRSACDEYGAHGAVHRTYAL